MPGGGGMSGPQAQMTQWYNPGTFQGPGNPSAIAGSMPPQPWVRSVLDARRMMWKRTPENEYPSGLIGTLTERNSDKVLDSLKARVNQRSYQRGVHLGERIDPGDYLWPEELDPFRGIQAVAQGVRQRPLMEWWQPTPSIEGRLAPRGSESVVNIDAHRASQMAFVAPKYGFPVKNMSVRR